MFGRSCRSIGLLVCLFWPLVVAPGLEHGKTEGVHSAKNRAPSRASPRR